MRAVSAGGGSEPSHEDSAAVNTRPVRVCRVRLRLYTLARTNRDGGGWDGEG